MDQVDPPAVGRLHPEPPMTHNDDDLSSKAIEAMNAGDWKRACTLWVLKVDKLYRLRAAGEIAPPAPTWQQQPTFEEWTTYHKTKGHHLMRYHVREQFYEYCECGASYWPLPPAPPQAPEQEPMSHIERDEAGNPVRLWLTSRALKPPLKKPLLIGTVVEPYGRIAAVLWTGGERYYHLLDDDGCVSMMPATEIERGRAPQEP